MIFESKFALPARPKTDVFNYIFHQGRRAYPWSRVLYKVDGTDETLTLAQLEEKSRSLADVLRREYEIHPMDVVGILAKDKIEYPIAYFGALAAGATVALIPAQEELSESDVCARLKQSQVKLLITDSDMLQLAEQSSNLAGGVRIITLDRITSTSMTWPHVRALAARGRPDANIFHLHTEQSAEDHDAFVNRTSGSTGNVKSVMTSHAHFIATMEGTVGTIPDNTDPDNDVWLSPLSLGFFINAKLNMGLNILLGIPVVLIKGNLQESTADVIARHNITFLFITPPTAAKFARVDFKGRGVRLDSVKWLLTAGAPMHENLRKTVSDQFGGVHMDLEWGTSETMLIAIQRDQDSRQEGQTGTLVHGMQAKVLATDGTARELGPGEAGEILVRSQICRFKGYKDNEVANRDFDDEGWFHSGDYGYLDANSNVVIIDRIKELLKVGQGYGTHISATELEAVVFQHSAVASAVVVGIRNELTQLDEPTAFVVLNAGYNYTDANAEDASRLAELHADIVQFANRRLTGLQSLTGGIRILSHYPTIGFKINRRELKNMGPNTPLLPLPPVDALPAIQQSAIPQAAAPAFAAGSGQAQSV